MNEKYLAELFGAFAGDGWMTQGKSSISLFITGNPKDEINYYETRIHFLFHQTFNFDIQPRNFKYWKTYGIYTGKKSIINEFIKHDFPIGEKSSRVKVPKKILLNPKLHKSFLRGLFDTDGCIAFRKSYNKNASIWQKKVRHRPAVFITTISKLLAEQITVMFEKLQLPFSIRIESPRNGYKTSYRILLEGKANTKKFFNVIKPMNKKHTDKFETWLSQGFY